MNPDNQTRFREGKCRGGRAQGLEADLLQGVGEEPAPELDAVFGRASAGQEFAQHGFGAVDKAFLKVRLPSHSDRIADISEGPSRANELNRSRGRFPGESSHEAHWRPA